jgi:hypothetical protein
MINSLLTLLEKKDEHYIDNFLNSNIVITEKLDTYRILFEKKDNEIMFYKKDNSPLNLISRVLTNVWEDAIIELTTIIGDTMIPEGFRFGVAYTPVERPVRIPYSKLPKYILTDIRSRVNNKVVESYSYDEVTKWAGLLSMARPPVIFEGKLSEEQKNVLKSYGLKEYDKLEKRSFSELIGDLFGDTYSGEDIIEGIIIKSDNELAQIISYEFDILNEAYQKEEFTRDYYDIILLNINSFMDNYSMPILEGTSSDELYLEIVSDVFNKFCKKNPTIMENLKPEYLTPPSYGYFGRLNLLLIKNKETLDILEKGGKIYEALFRILLSSLRKPKKEFGLLTESAVQKFNTIVWSIKNIIYEELPYDDNLNESRSDNIVIDVLSRRQLSDLDNMRIIASIQKAFEPSILDIEKGKDKCVVYITECFPFTNQQINNVHTIYDTWKCPVIIGSVSNERKIEGKKFHFSDELLKDQLEAVAIFEKDTIPAYFILDNWSLKEIFEYCRPKYEPMAVISDVGKKAEFAIQLYFEEEIMGQRVNVEKNFNIGEMENKDQFVAMRAIEDNLFSEFAKSVPQSIQGLWDTMVSEYRVWSGKIITNKFEENKFI